jgi:hypothetical protein
MKNVGKVRIQTGRSAGGCEEEVVRRAGPHVPMAIIRKHFAVLLSYRGDEYPARSTGAKCLFYGEIGDRRVAHTFKAAGQ